MLEMDDLKGTYSMSVPKDPYIILLNNIMEKMGYESFPQAARACIKVGKTLLEESQSEFIRLLILKESAENEAV